MEKLKLKVLLYVSTIDRSGGGLTTYIKQLSSELKEYINLTIVTGRSSDPVEIPGVPLIIIRKELWRWFALEKDFYSILEEVNPDIVHINGIWEPQNYLFQKVSQKRDVIVIMSPHGMLEPYILNRHPYKKKLALLLYQKKAIEAANFIHATAQSELDQLKKLGFGSNAVVIPNGMDFSEVINYKITKNNGDFRLLFLSRIHPKKGLEILFGAIQNLKYKKIKLIIAGEGDNLYLKSLKQLSKKLGVEKQIDFIGGVYGKDKWKAYQEADLFVLPTHSENFGLVVIEALAVGLPVITTRGTPWQELIMYRCGWWIELNVMNLQKAIQEAIDKSSAELKEMGERGKAMVISRYDIKTVSKSTLNFYQTVSKNKNLENSS